MTEEWLPVIGYEHLYQVSSGGRVRNKKAIMKTHKSSSGYEQVGLRKLNTARKHSVHRLVAIHFISNPHNYTEIDHLDGDKFNNSCINLEWVTHSTNMERAYENGLVSAVGASNGRAKLTELQVVNIRHCKGSVASRELAKLYGVSKTTVSAIWCHKQWEHI